MLSPSLMFQEALGGHGVLGPPKGHEVQGGPVRGDKTSGALELTVTSHLASSLLPDHLQSQILGLTEGPGSPFFPGSPGPPPPVICPGSPCVRQKAVVRVGEVEEALCGVSVLSMLQALYRVWPEAPPLLQGISWSIFLSPTGSPFGP